MWICNIFICLAFLARASSQQDAYIMSSLGDHGDRITDLESSVRKMKAEFGGLNHEIATLKNENKQLKSELKALNDVCNSSQCCQCSTNVNTGIVTTSPLDTSRSSSPTASITRTETLSPKTNPLTIANNITTTTTEQVSMTYISSTTNSNAAATMPNSTVNPHSTTTSNAATTMPNTTVNSLSTTNSNAAATMPNSMVNSLSTTVHHTENITSAKQLTTTAASTTSAPMTSPPVQTSTGTTAKPVYDDCIAAYRAGIEGVVSIKLGTTGHNTQAYCDKDGWLVIQRRETGNQDFNQNWRSYKNGFGDLGQDFWFGNDKLNQLTSTGDYTLRIEMEDWAQNKKYAEYGHFRIDNELNYYRLFVGSYSGNAGDSFHFPSSYQLTHFQMPFSTPDRDNDRSSLKCADQLSSGWWFNDCYSSNLNGQYLPNPYGQRKLGETYGQPTLEGTGIEWYPLKQRQYSLKHAVMKIKPQQVSRPMG